MSPRKNPRHQANCTDHLTSRSTYLASSCQSFFITFSALTSLEKWLICPGKPWLDENTFRRPRLGVVIRHCFLGCEAQVRRTEHGNRRAAVVPISGLEEASGAREWTRVVSHTLSSIVKYPQQFKGNTLFQTQLVIYSLPDHSLVLCPNYLVNPFTRCKYPCELVHKRRYF